MGIELAASLERIGLLELFRSLPVDGLKNVRAAMRVERVPKDATVFEQGGVVDRAYALATGSVRIVQSGSDGGQALVRFIGPGEMFGTVPLFTDHRFPADAITAEASTILTWSERDLLDLLDRYPVIHRNVIRVLGVRMAQLQERVRELTTQRVEQRIAHAILRLVEQAGRDGTRGTTIEIPLRRKDLAEYAGTTLHTASRMVSAWEKTGLLSGDGQHLVIHDLAALRDLAEGGRHLRKSKELSMAATASEHPADKQSRAGRLKILTRETHDRLDKSVMSAGSFDSVEDYAHFVEVQYLFHRDIDALYRDAALQAVLPGLAERGRLALVEADLADLGRTLPPCGDLPAFRAGVMDMPTALGWLYVAEGSTMGAALLRKEVAKFGLSDDHGGRQLAPAPEGPAAHWRAFTAALDAVELTAEEEDRTVAGANSAFARVQALVDARIG